MIFPSNSIKNYFVLSFDVPSKKLFSPGQFMLHPTLTRNHVPHSYLSLPQDHRPMFIYLYSDLFTEFTEDAISMLAEYAYRCTNLARFSNLLYGGKD